MAMGLGMSAGMARGQGANRWPWYDLAHVTPRLPLSCGYFLEDTPSLPAQTKPLQESQQTPLTERRKES